jgi:hypothetical protein
MAAPIALEEPARFLGCGMFERPFEAAAACANIVARKPSSRSKEAV